jgi:hypothetical protein
MATYEGDRFSQGAEAPCHGHLCFASERPRIGLERRPNCFLVRGYDFCAPPLDVFVMVPFDVVDRRGESLGVREPPPVKLLRPDVVSRREVPRLDERACAVSFDLTNMLAELFGRNCADDEVHVVGEHVARHNGDAVLTARVGDGRGDELLVVGAEYDRLACFDVERGHPRGYTRVVRHERYEPPLHNPNPNAQLDKGF